MQKSRAEVVVRLRPPEREENVRETFDFPTDRPDVPLPPCPTCGLPRTAFRGGIQQSIAGSNFSKRISLGMVESFNFPILR